VFARLFADPAVDQAFGGRIGKEARPLLLFTRKAECQILRRDNALRRLDDAVGQGGDIACQLGDKGVQLGGWDGAVEPAISSGLYSTEQSRT
jgi:hypothetical protein